MADEIYSYVGQKIRTYRDLHGMSQEKLGKEIGVTANTISRWETAVYKPSVAELDRLARLFEEPIWVFLPSEIRPSTESQQKLLSATGDLPEEDLEELERYADFIRARKALRQKGNQTPRQKQEE